MVKGFPTVQHHFDPGSDSDSFNDPSGWNRASYESHPIDSIEPIDLPANSYRQAAIYHMMLMFCVDQYVTAAEDARLAVVAVAIVLGWPSTRGMTLCDIASQLGVSASTLSRACTRFREMSGLAGGGVRFIRPGAGLSNGDKPAAGQA